MATIGKVSAVFTASTSGLRTGVNQASRSMQQMQSSVSSLRGQLSALNAINGAQLFLQIANAASQAVQSLIRFGSSAAQSIDRTAKLSQQLGLTYSEMASLGLAAEIAGTDMETVGKAVTKANVAFANAAAGSKAATAAFARIGLSVDELNGLSAVDQFEKIGAAIAALPSEAEQAAAAVALFGRSGAQLLPLFQGAVASMDSAVKKANELGISLESVGNANISSVFDQINAAASGVQVELSVDTSALDQVNAVAASGVDVQLRADTSALDQVNALAASGVDVQLSVDTSALDQVNAVAASGVDVQLSVDTSALDQVNAVAASGVDVQLNLEASNALNQLGLAFDQIKNLSGEERFRAIGQAISELPGQAERAAAAVAIFGQQGAQLLPLFERGASGIQRATSDAERFGLALNNVQAGNVESMNDAFTRAQGAVQGVINQVVAYLAPALENVTTVFTELIGGIGGANIGQFIGEGILEGARFFAGVADQFVAQAGPLFDYLASVGQQWSAMWDIGQRVASLFAGIGNVLAIAIRGAVLPFSGLVQLFARLVRDAAGLLGFDTKGLDQVLAGVRGFNSQLLSDIGTSFEAAGQNFSDVIGERTKTSGRDLAGPFTTALDEGLRRAREAAEARDEAVKQVVEVKQPPVEVNVAPLKEAVKGIESRSSEGIKEMFRIMRGPPPVDPIQQRQLEAAEETARNTRGLDFGLDFDVVDLPAAAGA